MARLAQAVLLALALVAIPATAVATDSVPRNPEQRRSCMTDPPRYIKVFMIHRKGSSTPAYIRRVPFRWYVQTVMASGAWPGSKPLQSLKVGAIAIKQYAMWHICHHQRLYVWRGVRYHIRQGDQYFMPGRAHRINRKIERAVNSTWHTWLRKDGRYFRTGWRGNAGRDG